MEDTIPIYPTIIGEKPMQTSVSSGATILSRYKYQIISVILIVSIFIIIYIIYITWFSKEKITTSNKLDESQQTASHKYKKIEEPQDNTETLTKEKALELRKSLRNSKKQPQEQDSESEASDAESEQESEQESAVSEESEPEEVTSTSNDKINDSGGIGSGSGSGSSVVSQPEVRASPTQSSRCEQTTNGIKCGNFTIDGNRCKMHK